MFIRNKHQLVLPALISSLLLAPSIQAAQPVPPRGPIPFASFDLNEDGNVTLDEYQKIRDQRMTQKQQNGMRVNNTPSKQQFEQFDQNRDGKLSHQELLEGQQRQRQNRQGMNRGMGMGGPGHGMNRGMGMGGPGQGMNRGMGMGGSNQGMNRGMGMGGPGQGMNPGMGMGSPNQGMNRGMGMGGPNQGMNRGRNRPQFQDFDANHDGSITEQELTEGRSMRISKRIQDGYQMRNTQNISQFKDIDTNSDGRISQDEFYSHQRQQMQQMQNKMR